MRYDSPGWIGRKDKRYSLLGAIMTDEKISYTNEKNIDEDEDYLNFIDYQDGEE
jgi:hypothetical protein